MSRKKKHTPPGPGLLNYFDELKKALPDRAVWHCHRCKRLVYGGGHPCLADDGTPEEHLAECHCGANHEPPCEPSPSDTTLANE